MTTRHSLFGMLLLAGLLLAGCGAKSPDDSKVLARIDGAVITEKDYEDYLRARQMQQPPIPDPNMTPARSRSIFSRSRALRLLLTLVLRRGRSAG